MDNFSNRTALSLQILNFFPHPLNTDAFLKILRVFCQLQHTQYLLLTIFSIKFLASILHILHLCIKVQMYYLKYALVVKSAVETKCCVRIFVKNFKMVKKFVSEFSQSLHVFYNATIFFIIQYPSYNVFSFPVCHRLLVFFFISTRAF